MKRIIAFILCTVLLLAMTACSPKGPADLTGSWKQTNGSSDSYMTATISGNTVEVYWAFDGGDSTSLYWAGTFTAPTTADEPYTWTSTNDHAKTGTSLLSSDDDTKAFTYQKGELSFPASAFGVTTTVRMVKNK